MTPQTIHRPLGDDFVADEWTIDLFSLLCQRRGWNDEFISTIENGEHAPLKDLDTLVAALEDARAAGEVITIAPDYDMDGISSAMVGYAGLKELGFAVNLHVPDYERGHDLTKADIDEVAAAYPDTNVLLTCDGGVNSHAGIEAGKAKGWKVWVTDHHQELEPGCNADILVDPCRIDETYALRGICGAHVLYQIIESYTLTYQPEKLWAIRLLRLFAGLGTVSDVMPILHENRQLVRDSLSIARLLYVPAPKTIENRWGGFDPDPDAIDVSHSALLQVLHAEDHDETFVSVMEGFALVLKAFGQYKKLREIDSINESFYGFSLAPAMNSPRRTGAPIADCFTVFTATDEKTKLEAFQRVIENNERRKAMVIEHMDELTEGDQPLAPWVYFSSAYTGMFGLLASKLMEAHGHPVVVMARPITADEPAGGSGRAPDWFDIIAALEGHEQLAAIGHAQACGVKVAHAWALDELVKVLADATSLALVEAGAAAGSGADLILGAGADADASLAEVDALVELVRRIDSLRPFGHAFTEPVVEIVLQPDGFRLDCIGSEQQHLRLVTRHGVACLWWNAADKHLEELVDIQQAERAEPGSQANLRFTGTLQLNTFRGETRVQVIINDQVAKEE